VLGRGVIKRGEAGESRGRLTGMGLLRKKRRKEVEGEMGFLYTL
jgi:hypothetical protein